MEAAPDDRSPFHGDTEMATLMRQIDWAATPLGAVDSWSPSLKTLLRLLLGSESQLVVLWGPELRQFYNDGFRRILGGKHPKALGEAARDTWGEIWDVIQPMYAHVLAGGSTFIREGLLVLERHGFLEECYFDYSYSALRDETSQVAGILAICNEVTDRVVGERRLRALGALTAGALDAQTADAACRTAATGLSGAQHDLPFALIYLLDEDGTTAHLAGGAGLEPGHAAAPSTIALHDDSAPWPLREAIGGPCDVEIRPDLFCAEQPVGPWPQSPSAAVVLPLKRGEMRPLGFLVAGVSPRLHLDEAYREFLRLVASHLSGAIQQALTFEQETQRALALAQIDRAKTAFFSNVSHEFRTPLTLLLGPMQEALTSPARALQGEDLETAHRNAQRLLRLVNQLLDFMRVAADRAEARYEPTDLAALTTDLASSFRSAIEHGGLQLHVHCAPFDAPVLVDPRMWEDIVLNLLSNAFKFTLHGEIRVELRERAGEVELLVRDTGVGITQHELPRVFDRFHRVAGRPARTHEGSGIGLALVRDLVTLHKGQIAIASEVDRGTTVTVRIPLLRHQAGTGIVARASDQKRVFVDEVERWTPTVPAMPAPGEQQPLGSVLIADDNADMREYLLRLLGAHWHVHAVSNGREALDYLQAAGRLPDLVLADVMMPEVDGFELIAGMHADAQLAELPVVLLSARAGEEAVIDGLRAGAADYIVKPFTASALLVRLETQVAKAQAQRRVLREREHLFSVLAMAPAAVCVLRGRELRIEVANDRILEVWGRSRAVIGTPLLEALPELNDQPFPSQLLQVLETGQRWEEAEAIARLDSNRDGILEDLYFDYVYAPLRDDEGGVTGVLVFAVDVTHKVLARRRIEAALHDARGANESKDRFLALLGHELRNPLAPIRTALDLMRMREFVRVEKEVAVIERQTEHLSRLVDDLLDVARIAQGKVDLKYARCDLSEILLKAVELASPLLEQKRHRLEMDVPRGLIVDVDPTRITQVVSNILVNAAKYTPDGGNVRLRLRREAGRAVVTVRDNGIGLSPEMLAAVFDLFVQDAQASDRSRGGLGLGLAIVKSLVERHDGSVTATSEGRGKGCTFEVTLPLANAVVVESKPQAVTSHTRVPRRLLVVDDNEDAAAMLAEAATALGHQVRTASDAPSALKVVDGFTPDIALLDIGLPVMDGYELGRLLREKDSLKQLHLVAVTGYGAEVDQARSHDAGFASHLTKPVSLRDVAAVIDRLCEGD